MKILIVEDEWKTLKGLSNLIAELGGEYEIAGQARSGYIAAQGDLALIGGGNVGQDGGIVAAVDTLAHRDDRLLIDTRCV